MPRDTSPDFIIPISKRVGLEGNQEKQPNQPDFNVKKESMK